ncbi:MAG: hypothetical protein A3G87_06605 [Omnitrophica bacterium RIFCSPLOWO2_12_FULL_50_11]|nr:MAG: hypothetical protein A3G87_06605 [Omnitrophica bacterium RIFCSPLOWO2_12_FULL_50_11]
MDAYAYLYQCLGKVVSLKGHDLFLKVGSVPRARVGSTVVPLPFEAVTDKETRAIVETVLNPAQKSLLEQNRSVDFSFSLFEEMQRFRGNIFWQQNRYSVVIRMLWKDLPSFEELHIPLALRDIAVEQSGIILIGGTVGMGKTTTINAMINWMNAKSQRHILTIEDPIEYLHVDKGCVINQREIGQDANDFASALKYAVRQAPDVIMIGEMRDAESFKYALSASEVGRLVVSTIHAKSVVQIFDRVLGFFPQAQQDTILNHLSYHITCFAVEKLIVKKDGRTMVPAFEIMLGNGIVRELVREKEFAKIPQALRNAAHEGMQTMDDAIFKLWEDREISDREALSASEKPMELEKRMKGIEVQSQRTSILGA